MRSIMFKVLDFAIRILTRVRNRFAAPVPEARMYRVLSGYRRTLACKDILLDPAFNVRANSDAYDLADMKRQIEEAGKPWTVEEILAREG